MHLNLFLPFLALVTAKVPLKKGVPTLRNEVTSLPGWTTSTGAPAPLPSKQYTGYLPAGTPPSGKGTMYFHYWMIESESDPSTDPVLIWYNGGPGASSLFGLLQEFGTFLLTEESYDAAYDKTGIPSPHLNPHRWTANHTVIAIDSPPPMGMSFCSEEGAGGSPTSCGPWTDTSVFKANHEAHKTFFNEAFPELKSNPLYFTGESYAGIYVPGFVEELLNDPIPGLNFAGFAVGDGWTGCKAVDGKPNNWCVDLDNVGLFKYPNVFPGPWYDLQFFHGHSQMSNQLYRDILFACTSDELNGVVPFSAPCDALITKMSDQVGYFFPYNLYNACPNGAMRRRLGANQPFANGDKHGMNQALRTRRTLLAGMTGKDSFSGLNSPCLGQAMPEWLLRNDTLKALGAPLDTKFINLDNGHGFNYTSDALFVAPIYEHALAKGLRVMVYEGDNDACGLQTSPVEDIFVPLFDGTMKQTQEWRPWTTDGASSMGGYVVEWNERNAQFVSIRGAGHLSPLNRPLAAQTMMNQFTSGQPMPKFTQPA